MAKEKKNNKPRGFPKAKCNRKCPEGSNLSNFSLKNGHKRNYCKPLEEIQQMKKIKQSIEEPKKTKKEKVTKEIKSKEELELESEKEANPDYQANSDSAYRKNKDCYSKTSKKLAKEYFGEYEQVGCSMLDKERVMVISSKKDSLYNDIKKDYTDCDIKGIRERDNRLELLITDKSNKKGTIISKSFYDQFKKDFNESCKCNDVDNPVILSTKTHEVAIAPRVVEKDTLEQEFQSFIPMKEYEELQSKSKEQLALLSGDKRKNATKDSHIRWILKQRREKKQRDEYELRKKEQMVVVGVPANEKMNHPIISMKDLEKGKSGLVHVTKLEDLPDYLTKSDVSIKSVEEGNLYVASYLYFESDRAKRFKKQ